MWDEYGVFGNHELWNNDRTYSYATLAGIKDLGLILNQATCSMPLICDQPPGVTYTTPALDAAPWYDAAYPESAEFAGIFVQSVTGFDNFGSRSLTGTPFGTVASRRNMDPKTLTVNALLVGSTCCATQYGYQWLLSKLLERDCIDGVEVSQLSMYSCCPTESERGILTDDQIIEEYLRAMYRVRVGVDPTIVQEIGNCCGEACMSTTLAVQWTFVLENQKIYRNVDLCIDDSEWPVTTECIDYDCITCDEDATTTIEVIQPKRRYPAKVLANRTWCPVGDWTAADHFDAPDESYIDIVDTEIETNPLNIYVGFDGTFRVYSYQTPIPDLLTVDLCKVNFQVTDFAPSASAGYAGGGVSGAAAFQSVSAEDTVILPIRLVPSDGVSGTWEPVGWTRVSVMPNWPPEGAKIVIDNSCGCVDHSDDGCQIQFNSDLSWSPLFDYIGTFPPIGCNSITAYNQSSGTYISEEELSFTEAFAGGPESEIQVDSYAGTTSTYCQPVEWKQQCCKITFTSGVERAEPYVEYFSGSEALYNFRADFYKLESATDTCLCDTLTPGQAADWACRTPDFSIKAGRAIPANSYLIYEPRTRQIRGVNDDVVYDASGMVTGKTNGSPFFFEFPDCYGVCVVFTAEVRRDESDVIISPADDATVSAGHLVFSYVGV